MSSITINSATPVSDNIQWNVMYEQFNAPKYPSQNAILNLATDNTLYTSGRLLSVYTTANAPTPAQVGTYVNYDPASLNLDQKVPVAIISEEWVNNYSGVDFTNTATTTATFRQIQVTPLLIGSTMYKNTLVANNPAAVITGFNAYFTLDTISTVQLNGASCPLITIQGVA